MAKNKKLSISDLLEESLGNLRSDRKLASALLADVAVHIGSDPDRHREVGLTAAKYLETLQKSNEQLVKITGMIKSVLGAEEDEFSDLNEKDKENIYQEFEDKKEKKEKPDVE